MGRESSINIYIWCAAGAIVGWVFATVLDGATLTGKLENVAAGAFGAVLGGDVVAAAITGVKLNEAVFSLPSLIAAVACAIATVLLLGVMRKAVGPLRSSKSRPRR
ncbi:MAG: hypothetical protein AVDCRST_MAG51-2804 [uncultured Ramlibacter sp.]|uniref:GlsB/YeaQ/YmgE family stress response membrane protein n=1 Tax=uncultured Ramlibacter sp. TaxID=260755 RepID=A0A6J4Q9F0_9BURK|nr:MAG: hypothetical protein AVDCRST_MAG51-2804 [uncultured Ramlibacter sp.]